MTQDTKAAPLALAEEIKDAIYELAAGRWYPDLIEAVDRLAAAASPPLPATQNDDTGAVRIHPPEFPKMPAGAHVEQLSREELWGWACLTGWRCAALAATPAVEAGQALTDEDRRLASCCVRNAAHNTRSVARRKDHASRRELMAEAEQLDRIADALTAPIALHPLVQEYEEWIRFFNAGNGDYTDFLRARGLV